jgi:hypothetical protein
MPTQVQPGARKSRVLRCVAGLILTLLLAGTLVGVWTYHHFGDPERVRALVIERIQRATTGRAHIAAATFSFFDGVHLRDVSVSPPQTTGDDEPVFQCAEIVIRHHPFDALIGRFRARSVMLREPVLTIVQDAATHCTNLTELIEGFKRRKRPSSPSRPTVEVRKGTVRLLARSSDSLRAVEELHLTARAKPTTWDADLYDVVWQTPGKESSGHTQLHVKSGAMRSARGGSPPVAVEAAVWLAQSRYPQAEDWGERLGLSGQLRLREFELDLGGSGVGHHAALIEVAGSRFSIPIDAEENDLPASARFLQFQAVGGEIEVSDEGIQARLSGRLHGSECSLTATVRKGVEQPAVLDDLEIDATMRAANLELPTGGEASPFAQQRVVGRWPSVRRFFENYDPHGRVDLVAEVVKPAGPQSRVTLRRLAAVAQGGDASCRFFPYRADRLSGAIEYNSDGVWIRDVCGEHDGGRVCVNGHFERPHRCAAGELTIAAEKVPIDQRLREALGPAYQRALAPLQLEGRIGVGVALHRAACEGELPATWQWRADVTLAGVAAEYSEFPIPARDLNGQVVVQPDSIDITNVTGAAGGVRVNIAGAVLLDGAESPSVDVALSTRDAVFNETLMATLPASARDRLAAWQPSGPFELRARFRTDEQTRRVAASTTVTLQGATVRHHAFPIDFTDIRGDVQIDSQGLSAPQLTARYREAAIDISGRLDRTTTTADLSIRARGLRIDDALRDAFPQPTRDALQDWEVLDPIEATVNLRTERDDRTPAYNAEVRLDGAGVKHGAFPIPFTDVRGVVRSDESGVRANALRARYGAADIQADFHARRGVEGMITLTATNLLLDRSIRDALPSGLRDAWDGARPRGRVDLQLQNVHYRKAAAAAHTTWDVRGQVELHDVSLPGVSELSSLTGVCTAHGAIVDPSGGTTLSGQVALRTLQVHERLVSPADSVWSFARTGDGQGRFALQRVRGTLYDGDIGGELEVILSPGESTYHATVAVHGVQIGPLIDAGRIASADGSDDSAPPKPNRVRGTADGSFYLSGEFGDALSRRGGGQLEIRDGYIYRLPILLAILNVLRMSPPADSVLHNAQSQFYVTGNRILFEELELSGGVLALVGSGSLSLPDQAVDLQLVNIGSRHLARIPVLSDFLEGAGRELVELRVTGPISRPTVRAQPLRGLTDELGKLFQKKPRKVIPPAE